jgi:hypothetical protein
VHVSAFAKSLSGFRTNEEPPPVTAAVCVPLVPHEIVYHPSARSTASLNVMPMFASTATSVAPSAGVWLVTVGGASVSGLVIVTVYGDELERSWSSVTVQLLMRWPGTESLGTVTVREKTRPLASGLSELVLFRPAQLRSQVTASPVLSGFVPGVTVAVIVTSELGAALGGATVIAAVGGVESSAAAELPARNMAMSAHASSALGRRREVFN